jgi:hypothetical protein
MAKVTIVITDKEDGVDVVAEFLPSMPKHTSERTNAQQLGLKVSEALTRFGMKNAGSVSVDTEDDRDNHKVKTYVNGVEVKPNEQVN